LKVTQEAYGMTFRDPDAFLKWTMSIVNFVFGKPGGGAYKLRAALAAGALIDQEIQSNIKKRKSHKDTVLRTMLANRIKAERIQPTLAALLVGGMPTITQAGYNIMKVLLANRDAMAMTVAAARHDDDSLRLCLREALRFSPVLPVIFRKYVVPSKVNRDPADPAEAAAVAGAGGLVDWLGRPIPSGADVGIFCLTANFDARRVASPTRFDPTRPLSDNMAFGHGRHWCLGVPIAMAVLVNMFRPLLLQGPITARKGAPRTRFFMDYFAENFEISIGRNGP
jgi:cytochrome P450